jgi:hypothetical protein
MTLSAEDHNELVALIEEMQIDDPDGFRAAVARRFPTATGEDFARAIDDWKGRMEEAMEVQAAEIDRHRAIAEIVRIAAEDLGIEDIDNALILPTLSRRGWLGEDGRTIVAPQEAWAEARRRAQEARQ